MQVKNEKGLTAKQEAFCHFFMESLNASEAYRKAYSCEKSSEKTIWECSSRLLNDRKVAARLNELKVESRAKSEVTREEIIKMLSNIMRADIRDFLTVKNGNVTFKDSDEWTNEMAMQVESVRQTRDGMEIKLNGRTWSIERICKMLGFDSPTEIALKNGESEMSREDMMKELERLEALRDKK